MKIDNACRFAPLVLALALVGMPARAQADCYANITRTAPDSRYTDHGNGTVTDNITGLVWKQCTEGQSDAGCAGTAAPATWQVALQQADAASFAGYDDWRLPDVNELNSLIEEACYPKTNPTFFPNTQTGDYWSSSSNANFSSNAWAVGFNDGSENLYQSKISAKYVRLVRGGR